MFDLVGNWKQISHYNNSILYVDLGKVRGRSDVEEGSRSFKIT